MSDNEKPTFNPGGTGRPADAVKETKQKTQTAAPAALSLEDIFQPTAVASRGGVATAKVKEIFEQISAEFDTKSKESRKIYVTIADESPLRVPACVLYSVDGARIYTYPLILEACGEVLEPRTVPGAGGKLITVDMPTSRYYTQTMRNICNERVMVDAVARGLMKGGEVMPISFVVIKKTVPLDNKEKLAPFFDSAVAAIMAQYRFSMGMTTSQLTAKMLSQKSLQMVSRNRITPGATSVDPFGSVVAQDFKIELLARAADRNSGDIHTEGREAIISSITGYVDFAYHTPSQLQISQSLQVNNPINIPAYDPYLVITSATPLGASTTLGDNLLTQCMALASVSGMCANQRWVSVFTKGGSDSGDKASVGAFALEHDPNYIKVQKPHILKVSAGLEPVVAKDTFSPLEVIQKFCYNSMAVAMDVEQGGPMTWVQALFAKADIGSSAEALIIKELDRFSDGMFSSIWNQQGSVRQPILAYPSVDIHLGHFTVNGKTRDIRSLDYLTMLVASQGDPSVMTPYSEGMRPGSSSPEAMNMKREIIKSYAQQTEFTGIATRVFINTAFINALEQMFAAVNLRIILEGIPDVMSVGGRGSSFEGGFNAPIIGHGAFQQNYGTAVNSAPTNYFQGLGFGR